MPSSVVTGPANPQYLALFRAYRNEIDYLNGAVAEQGAQSGIACPINKRVTDLVKSLQTSALVAVRPPLGGNTLKFQLHLE